MKSETIKVIFGKTNYKLSREKITEMLNCLGHKADINFEDEDTKELLKKRGLLSAEFLKAASR